MVSHSRREQTSRNSCAICILKKAAAISFQVASLLSIARQVSVLKHRFLLPPDCQDWFYHCLKWHGYFCACRVGWRMPVGLMISQRIMPVVDNEPSVENDAESVAAYFNLSCAPRASNNGPQNTPDGNGRLWPPLCEICKVSSNHRSISEISEGAASALQGPNRSCTTSANSFPKLLNCTPHPHTQPLQRIRRKQFLGSEDPPIEEFPPFAHVPLFRSIHAVF